ncbi:MAG: glycosyltransferase family 4 protein [Lachnospiraceae bacterium]|nr:glycosyltransferase family 4 protein [Lachnospiraceae bacterium]
MKILHVCLGCFYIDNYSYQENMLPKFHKRMGYDVEIIASTLSFDKNGNGCNIDPGIYDNEYGIKVTRLPYKKGIPAKVGKFLRLYEGFVMALDAASPDIIFVHGCQFCDINVIVRYVKKHPNVTVYVDNHADFSNSATNWLSKNVLHKGLWKHCAHQIEPYTKKFYGVLPVRVDFLKNIYGLPTEKCELLVMGADDELVEKAKTDGACERVRKQYGISDDDFLILTGGKIDKWKTQTLLLMQAVQNIQNDKVRLIVFGSVTKELMDQVKALADGKKVQYIGWIQSKDSYDYFEAADLVVFPGRHSVMWEQVTGQGKPMLVKDWEGTHHVDLGGNVVFLSKDSVEEIQSEIERLINNPEEYESMKRIAEKEGMRIFSYKDISRRAI